MLAMAFGGGAPETPGGMPVGDPGDPAPPPFGAAPGGIAPGGGAVTFGGAAPYGNGIAYGKGYAYGNGIAYGGMPRGGAPWDTLGNRERQTTR